MKKRLNKWYINIKQDRYFYTHAVQYTKYIILAAFIHYPEILLDWVINQAKTENNLTQFAIWQQPALHNRCEHNLNVFNSIFFYKY